MHAKRVFFRYKAAETQIPIVISPDQILRLVSTDTTMGSPVFSKH